jgi:predicted alpha/beta hydrolase family esterase
MYKWCTYVVYPNSCIVGQQDKSIAALPCQRYDYEFLPDGQNSVTRRIINMQPRTDTMHYALYHKEHYDYMQNHENFMHKPDKATDAIIIIHGLSGSPETMNGFFCSLKDKYPNKAIFIVSLPHNTGKLYDRALDTDAIEKRILDSVAAIRETYPNLTIVAHSFGGTVVSKLIADKKIELTSDHAVLIAPCFGSIGSELTAMQKASRLVSYYFEKLASSYSGALTVLLSNLSIYRPSKELIDTFGDEATNIVLSRLTKFSMQNKCIKYCDDTYDTVSKNPELFSKVTFIKFDKDDTVPSSKIAAFSENVSGATQREMQAVMHSYASSHYGFLITPNDDLINQL